MAFGAQIVEDTGVAVLGGEFCGQTGHAHTYLTTSKSVTLHSLPGAKTDHFNAYFDVLVRLAFHWSISFLFLFVLDGIQSTVWTRFTNRTMDDEDFPFLCRISWWQRRRKSLDAVKRRYAEMRRASDGEPAPETLCDVVLHNCKSQCRITSPHYPSAYPRNVTCRHRFLCCFLSFIGRLRWII